MGCPCLIDAFLLAWTFLSLLRDDRVSCCIFSKRASFSCFSLSIKESGADDPSEVSESEISEDLSSSSISLFVRSGY